MSAGHARILRFGRRIDWNVAEVHVVVTLCSTGERPTQCASSSRLDPNEAPQVQTDGLRGLPEPAALLFRSLRISIARSRVSAISRHLPALHSQDHMDFPTAIV